MWIGWVESNFTNPIVKVWADLDNPLKRSDYAKLCMSPSLDGTLPEYVISHEDNSPMNMYIDFHNFLIGLSKFTQTFAVSFLKSFSIHTIICRNAWGSFSFNAYKVWPIKNGTAHRFPQCVDAINGTSGWGFLLLKKKSYQEKQLWFAVLGR